MMSALGAMLLSLQIWQTHLAAGPLRLLPRFRDVHMVKPSSYWLHRGCLDKARCPPNQGGDRQTLVLDAGVPSSI